VIEIDVKECKKKSCYPMWDNSFVLFGDVICIDEGMDFIWCC